MRSLLSQIVSELVGRYPSASSEDISKVLLVAIESDILPNAIRIMRLPRQPSKMQLLLERKREERRPKKYRRIILKQKGELIEDFEFVKYSLNDRETGYSSIEYALGDGDFDDAAMYTSRVLGMSFVREDIERKDGIPLQSEVGFRRFREPLEQERTNPYTKSRPKKEMRTVGFLMSSEIQDKVIADRMFRGIIGSIEIRLREFTRSFPEMIFDISMKKDVEIPSWEKIIVKVTIPNLSLERKLDAWDQIDAELRKVFYETLQRVDASKAEEVDTINKKLLTKVVL